jgi:hypothetical protein
MSSPTRTNYINDIARKVYFKRKKQETLQEIEDHFHKCLDHIPLLTKQEVINAEMLLGYSAKQHELPHKKYLINL